jgi:hypothetical protein
MNDVVPRFWPIFFEVYEALPRQGPGNHATQTRCLSRCVTEVRARLRAR